MFRHIQKELYEIRDLAKDVNNLETDPITKKHNNRLAKKERQIFEDYLNTLDFDIIKILKCIMYIARDEDYNPKLTPIENYTNFRSVYDQIPGWNDKSIEIDEISGKLPELYDFLNKAYTLFNV